MTKHTHPFAQRPDKQAGPLVAAMPLPHWRQVGELVEISADGSWHLTNAGRARLCGDETDVADAWRLPRSETAILEF